VQLWNRPLIDNLTYGLSHDGLASLATIVDVADLKTLLEQLPEGFGSSLGEAGGLVSGGEGQRVRFGRALLRPDTRLVVLDEPFRGLDRVLRAKLLRRARQLWSDATFLCITHDVSETLDFERVLVVDGGRIVEDDVPQRLAQLKGSMYRAMLETETAVHEELWSYSGWRRLRLDRRQISHQ
jgi:ATP-binding cassette subfamily B protein